MVFLKKKKDLTPYIHHHFKIIINPSSLLIL